VPVGEFSHKVLLQVTMEKDGPDTPPANSSPDRSALSVDPESGTTHVWTARVRGSGEGDARAYTRNHSFVVGGQASFAESSQHPMATDYLLGALGGDLISGFSAIAKRRGLVVDAIEARVSGQLNNPLVVLGVVGETGHPGFQAISATLYVSVDADEALLEEVWQETLNRSPLVNTLNRSVDLALELKGTI
jgi:uncharacterized OsmC-like protein